jgi:hypothetical protein
MPEDTPPKEPTKDVADAAANGTHLELLQAMRTRIAKQVNDEDCPPRDLASLTRRLQDIGKEIATLEERAKQEDRESNPCKSCGGTGVERDRRAGGSPSGASSTSKWEPE